MKLKNHGAVSSKMTITLAMIKPDAYDKQNEIIQILLSAGFRILRLKQVFLIDDSKIYL
jgi:nucleoside diphosphate kinase